MPPDSPGSHDVDARLTRLEVLVQSTERLVEAFGPTAHQVIEVGLDLKHLEKEVGRIERETAVDMGDFKAWIAQMETRLAERMTQALKPIETEQARQAKAIEQFVAARQQSRTAITVAAIAGVLTLMGVIITTLATVLT